MTHDRTPAPLLDETDLARIETLVAAATRAPWYPFVSPWPDKMHAVTATDEAGPPIAYVGNTLLGGPANDANLQFIAAARTDVPALVVALRAAWRERDIALGEVLLAESDRNTWKIKWYSTEEAYQEAAADRDRYRAALEFTVARVDNIVAHHCGRDAGERFCEEYGCSSLVELVEPLRTALAAPGAGGEATEERTT